MLAEQDIWSSLLTVNGRGFLRWKDGGGDDRDPERFMAMCGNLHSLEEHNPTLDIDDLKEIGPARYSAPHGEITGVNGLLRLTDKFPISVRKPDNILVVGAITPNSLQSVLSWSKRNNWLDIKVTLVDKSPVPIRTMRSMQDGGYLNWPGGIELVEKDILHYEPSTPPKVIIADILNSWTVDSYQYPNLDNKSPYTVFENLLRWGSRHVAPNGWIFSRSMIAPLSRGKPDPNNRFHEQSVRRAEKIIKQLGPLADRANHLAIQEMVEELFDEPSLATFCGLNKVSRIFRSERALAGDHAVKVFRRLHRRNFTTTHEIDVDDPNSGFRFLNFACNTS